MSCSLEKSNGVPCFDYFCSACQDDWNAKEVEVHHLRAQLPEGMKDCTILFRECGKGHTWLTATNWIEHGCFVCQRDELKKALEVLNAEMLFKGIPIITSGALEPGKLYCHPSLLRRGAP